MDNNYISTILVFYYIFILAVGKIRKDGIISSGFGTNYWVLNEDHEPFVLELIEGVDAAIIYNEPNFKKQYGNSIKECGFSLRALKK